MKSIKKTLKAILKPVVPVSLSALVALGGVVSANAATRKMGDVDGNKRVSITDVTLIQRLLAEMITDETGEITKFGDIVLVPGVLNVFAEFNNRAGDEYSGHLYVCAVTEAVVPITPDPNDPTKTEERRELAEPYPSVINKDNAVVFRNEGVVAEASVKVLSNGVLGDLTVIREIELN